MSNFYRNRFDSHRDRGAGSAARVFVMYMFSFFMLCLSSAQADMIDMQFPFKPNLYGGYGENGTSIIYRNIDGKNKTDLVIYVKNNAHTFQLPEQTNVRFDSISRDHGKIQFINSASSNDLDLELRFYEAGTYPQVPKMKEIKASTFFQLDRSSLILNKSQLVSVITEQHTSVQMHELEKFQTKLTANALSSGHSYKNTVIVDFKKASVINVKLSSNTVSTLVFGDQAKIAFNTPKISHITSPLVTINMPTEDHIWYGKYADESLKITGRCVYGGDNVVVTIDGHNTSEMVSCMLDGSNEGFYTAYFSQTLNLPRGEDTLVINANQRDIHGNVNHAETVYGSFNDGAFKINPLPPINLTNQSSYLISGECHVSDGYAQRDVNVSITTSFNGSIHTLPLGTTKCAADRGNTWSLYVNLSTIDDEYYNTIITAEMIDKKGDLYTEQQRIFKDCRIDYVTINPIPEVNSLNQSNFTIGGQCSRADAYILVYVKEAPSIYSNIECDPDTLAWEASLDLSNLNNSLNSITFEANQTDAAWNVTNAIPVTTDVNSASGSNIQCNEYNDHESIALKMCLTPIVDGQCDQAALQSQVMVGGYQLLHESFKLDETYDNYCIVQGFKAKKEAGILICAQPTCDTCGKYADQCSATVKKKEALVCQTITAENQTCNYNKINSVLVNAQYLNPQPIYGMCAVSAERVYEIANPNFNPGVDTYTCSTPSLVNGQYAIQCQSDQASCQCNTAALKDKITSMGYQVTSIDQNSCAANGIQSVSVKCDALKQKTEGTDDNCSKTATKYVSKQCYLNKQHCNDQERTLIEGSLSHYQKIEQINSCKLEGQSVFTISNPNYKPLPDTIVCNASSNEGYDIYTCTSNQASCSCDLNAVKAKLTSKGYTVSKTDAQKCSAIGKKIITEPGPVYCALSLDPAPVDKCDKFKTVTELKMCNGSEEGHYTCDKDTIMSKLEGFGSIKKTDSCTYTGSKTYKVPNPDYDELICNPPKPVPGPIDCDSSSKLAPAAKCDKRTTKTETKICKGSEDGNYTCDRDGLISKLIGYSIEQSGSCAYIGTKSYQVANPEYDEAICNPKPVPGPINCDSSSKLAPAEKCDKYTTKTDTKICKGTEGGNYTCDRDVLLSKLTGYSVSQSGSCTYIGTKSYQVTNPEYNEAICNPQTVPGPINCDISSEVLPVDKCEKQTQKIETKICLGTFGGAYTCDTDKLVNSLQGYQVTKVDTCSYKGVKSWTINNPLYDDKVCNPQPGPIACDDESETSTAGICKKYVEKSTTRICTGTEGNGYLCNTDEITGRLSDFVDVRKTASCQYTGNKYQNISNPDYIDTANKTIVSFKVVDGGYIPSAKVPDAAGETLELSKLTSWEAISLGNKLYSFKNLQSGLYLEVPYGKCENGAAVTGTQKNIKAHQQWYLVRSDRGISLIPSHCQTHAVDLFRKVKEFRLYKYNSSNINQAYAIKGICSDVKLTILDKPPTTDTPEKPFGGVNCSESKTKNTSGVCDKNVSNKLTKTCSGYKSDNFRCDEAKIKSSLSGFSSLTKIDECKYKASKSVTDTNPNYSASKCTESKPFGNVSCWESKTDKTAGVCDKKVTNKLTKTCKGYQSDNYRCDEAKIKNSLSGFSSLNKTDQCKYSASKSVSDSNPNYSAEKCNPITPEPIPPAPTCPSNDEKYTCDELNNHGNGSVDAMVCYMKPEYKGKCSCSDSTSKSIVISKGYTRFSDSNTGQNWENDFDNHPNYQGLCPTKAVWKNWSK